MLMRLAADSIASGLDLTYFVDLLSSLCVCAA